MPFIAPEEKRSSKQKRTFSGTMEINPKRNNTTSRGNSQFKKGMLRSDWSTPTDGL